MNAASLVERYVRTDAQASRYRAPLQSWLLELGLFPPDVDELTSIDLAAWSPETGAAVRAMVRWAVDSSLIAVDPFAGAVATSCADLPFSTVVSLFLDHSRRHHKNGAKTAGWYAESLNKFLKRWPRISVAEIRPHHLNTWLDERYRPKQVGTRRQTIARVQAPLTWAMGQGLIRENPLKSVKKGKMPRRKKVLSCNEHDILYSNVPDDAFRDVLAAIQDSGARPGEVVRVEASMVDFAAMTWTLDEHKTDEKVDRPRVIYLTPRLLEVTRRLAARHPFGPIFRNTRGRPWTVSVIGKRVWRLKRRLRLDPKIVPYSYRHTYATNALVNGVPVATVAQLLGHVDLSMLAQHYAHLEGKTDHLRAAAAIASGRPDSGGGTPLKIWS